MRKTSELLSGSGTQKMVGLHGGRRLHMSLHTAERGKGGLVFFVVFALGVLFGLLGPTFLHDHLGHARLLLIPAASLLMAIYFLLRAAEEKRQQPGSSRHRGLRVKAGW